MRLGLPLGLTFHHLEHTLEVVEFTTKICKYLRLGQQDEEVVTIAAWFHDLGHIMDYEQHENYSQLMARGFLEDQGYNQDRMIQVCDCIAATKLPQAPKSLLAEILCDADLAHLATPNYFQWIC